MPKKKIDSASETALASLLASLANMFPASDSFDRVQFPKMVFKSQTELDDEDKVLVKGGTMFVDRMTEEVDEDGKTLFDRTELGSKVDGHIIFHRKRLQMWDGDNEDFYSSPLYDKATDVVPLFKGREFVQAGTPAKLKKLYPKEVEYVDSKTCELKSFTVSELNEVPVLYVVVDNELFELTINGRSSIKQWKAYLKKTAVPTTITQFHSSKQTKGSNKWNQMEFKALRDPSKEEAEKAIEIGHDLLKGIEMEKEYYATKRAEMVEAAEETEALALEGNFDEDEL